jgi:quercetin dioxygenase-like cupin family protein
MRIAFCFICLFLATVAAQELSSVDPSHAKVQFENDRVKVVRVQLGPHEKMALHEHGERVIVWLTDTELKVTDEHGKTQTQFSKAGSAAWGMPGKPHYAENLRNTPVELLEIDVKPATSPASTKK